MTNSLKTYSWNFIILAHQVVSKIFNNLSDKSTEKMANLCAPKYCLTYIHTYTQYKTQNWNFLCGFLPQMINNLKKTKTIYIKIRTYNFFSSFVRTKLD